MSLNRGIWLTISARLVVSAVLVLGVSGTTWGECPVDDFGDRNDSGWIHCGQWSDEQQPKWDVADGKYCLGLRHPLRSPPPPPLNIEAQWAVAAEESRYDNGCLRFGFHAGAQTAGTWNTHFVASLRADCGDSGYRAMIGPSLGRISIYRQARLLADEFDHAFEEGRAYRAEFCARGTQLSLKYWALSGPEPAEPQLHARDELFSRGMLGVGVFIENDNQGPVVEGCFEDLRFVPDAHCRGDLDCNGAVDYADLRALVAAWGTDESCRPRRREDLDGDCGVGFSDAAILLRSWGQCAVAAGD